MAVMFARSPSPVHKLPTKPVGYFFIRCAKCQSLKVKFSKAGIKEVFQQWGTAQCWGWATFLHPLRAWGSWLGPSGQHLPFEIWFEICVLLLYALIWVFEVFPLPSAALVKTPVPYCSLLVSGRAFRSFRLLFAHPSVFLLPPLPPALPEGKAQFIFQVTLPEGH